jgi:hypothetical protein
MTKIFLVSLLLFPLAAIGHPYQLNRPAHARITGTVLLAQDRDMVAHFRPCRVHEGTKVEVLPRNALTSMPTFWSEVHVLEGECVGQSGWVGSARLETVNS